MGSTKGGAFDLETKMARELLNQKGNLNRRLNSDVIKPWVNGGDIVGRPKGKWIIDFGLQDQESSALYEAPFEYVKEKDLPTRLNNARAVYRERWWQHGESRPAMREALMGLERLVATARVAKHRVFVWLAGETIADRRVFVFAREDDCFFGVLHSWVHEVWSLRLGALHGGERPTYNNTTCFETFPLPWPPGQELADDPRVAPIASAARELDQLRENWLNPPDASETELKKRTLTNLYNARPGWPTPTRRWTGRSWDAYGWPADEVPAEVAEGHVLARLLALNGERAGE